MTRERKEEVVLVALVVSLAIHVGLMSYARPRIMTRTTVGLPTSVARGPMRVTKSLPEVEPVRIGSLIDTAPRQDAPPIQGEGIPLVSEMGVVASVVPEPAAPNVTIEPPQLERTSFDIRPVSIDTDVVSAKIPMSRIETPVARPTDEQAPAIDRLVSVATAPVDITLPAIGKDPDSVFLPSGIASAWIKPTMRDQPKPEEFKPAEEVFERVDEKVVAEEKKAVKTLVQQDNAVELESFVNLTMNATHFGKYVYFKVMLEPRTTLEVVPKDVVVIIDASGSIGSDRMGSIRRAAKKILRSATNSDDRFNLVAFRNKFSYLFRSWQPCTQKTFDLADSWLGNLVAHGRTDVFSTISSVLTLPRHPVRPLIALVVTDGDANEGVSDTAEILSRFTKLNGGLVSVYMYGVKSSANRELIDVLTHGNRGESFIFDGWRWSAGDGIEKLSERFRDPVLSDLQIIFSADTPAEVFPRTLKNLYRGETLSFVGRVPTGTKEVAFSLVGLNGNRPHEGFFRLPLAATPIVQGLDNEWLAEMRIDAKLQ